LTLCANAPLQGGAKCGAAIWGERNSAIVLSFGFLIFKNLFQQDRNPVAGRSNPLRGMCNKNTTRREIATSLRD